MKKTILLSLAALMASSTFSVYADNDYDDDIYYNPDKSKNEAKKKAKSNYIKNYSEIDVDEYNRRGQYYLTPVDTIGDGTATGEDFVYTQQIQKYINPTIVVDNADVLADVLANSYGNVEIIFDNGIPYFAPCTTLTGPAFYYASTWAPSWAWGWPGWNWSWGWGPSWAWTPGWSISWGWGPSWAWGWGPGWNWGPSWGWGWGPGAGPGWGPSPGFTAHHYRPMGNHRPAGTGNLNWAANTRPGGGVTVGNGRPGSSRPNSGRPSAVASNGTNYNYTSTGHRIAPGVSVNRNPASGNITGTSTVAGSNSRPAGSVDRGLTINGYSNRSGRNVNSGVNTRQNYGNTTGRGTSSYGTTSQPSRQSNSSSRSYNSGNSSRSYNSGSSRSSGGSFGGSRGGSSSGSRGGGGGGRHR